jgi:hypothetical protein
MSLARLSRGGEQEEITESVECWNDGKSKVKSLVSHPLPQVARGTETTEMLATDNNRQNRTPLEINMSTRSIEADKPFDYTPFDLTRFDHAQGLRQGLRQGLLPLMFHVATVSRLRLVTRASPEISSKR